MAGLVDYLEAEDFRKRHEEFYPVLVEYMAKEASLRLDQEARAAFPDLIADARDGGGGETVDAEVADLSRLVGGLPAVAFGDNPFFRLPAPTRRARDMVRRRPSAFPCTVMLITYLWLNAMSAAYADMGYGEYAHVLRAPSKKAKGAWVDARTAASAAHAGVFLTNDADQRARVNFIAGRSGLPGTAWSLADWLDRLDT